MFSLTGPLSTVTGFTGLANRSLNTRTISASGVDSATPRIQHKRFLVPVPLVNSRRHKVSLMAFDIFKQQRRTVLAGNFSGDRTELFVPIDLGPYSRELVFLFQVIDKIAQILPHRVTYSVRLEFCSSSEISARRIRVLLRSTLY